MATLLFRNSHSVVSIASGDRFRRNGINVPGVGDGRFGFTGARGSNKYSTENVKRVYLNNYHLTDTGCPVKISTSRDTPRAYRNNQISSIREQFFQKKKNNNFINIPNILTFRRFISVILRFLLCTIIFFFNLLENIA